MGTHRLGGSKRCMADQLRGSTRLWDTIRAKMIAEMRGADFFRMHKKSVIFVM